MAQISIITIARNESANLARLKNAIDVLGVPAPLQVETVLVDNGSTDGTANLARSLEFDTVVEAPGANVAQCRNIGVGAARGDWLVFIDADCEPALDWIEAAAPYMEQETILGWPVQPPEPPTWVQATWQFHWRCKNPAALSGNPVTEGASRIITTANLFIPKKMFERLGGFDEALGSGEDMNLLLRASQNGYGILAVPGLQVVHHGEPATLWQFFRQQLWHSNRGSFLRIVQSKGLKEGGNAVIFTFLYALTLGLLIMGTLLGLYYDLQWFLAWGPFVALVVLPAFAIAGRAGRYKIFPQLSILYAAYGLARTIDLLGVSPRKKSWRVA